MDFIHTLGVSHHLSRPPKTWLYLGCCSCYCLRTCNVLYHRKVQHTATCFRNTWSFWGTGAAQHFHDFCWCHLLLGGICSRWKHFKFLLFVFFIHIQFGLHLEDSTWALLTFSLKSALVGGSEQEVGPSWQFFHYPSIP